MAAPVRIAVVGSGAIGTYYGGKLAAGGADVHFLVRSDLSAVQRQGFRIRGPDEDLHLPRVNCYGTTREIGRCDFVLIAIKATANASLPDLIPPLVHDRTVLLTLQNGLGNEDFLVSHFGADRVLAGLCFICLRRPSPGVVERYDHGHISIGEFERKPRQRTRDIAAEFQRCGIQCSTVEDLTLERWRKLVWNIPFNGLSILAGGIDTAAMLADENLRLATVDLMEEVIAAANKCGFPLEDSAVQEQMKRTATMGHYKPSTLLDFEAGKELELEPIWGEPLRRALAAGARVPRLQLLYSLLRSVDEIRRAKADERRE